MQLNIENILNEFIATDSSDCYFTVGSCPAFRTEGIIKTQGDYKLTQDDIEEILPELLTEEGIEEFQSTLEYNTAIMWNGARFRVNVFRQRKQTAIVLRRIRTDIPTLEEMKLPAIYGNLILEHRGLILVVGRTGAGKSTTLAAMLGHRNQHGSGHIVTVEDPIEFIHEHGKCIFSQRDIGIDTYSFGIALKNALRQSPDVIVIGEIRDRETMEQAIIFAETGHLCIATLHANNANQAIERIINFFPEEKHKQILLNLSLNLRAIISQRLLDTIKGGRTIAAEILLNQGIIRDLIAEGRVKEIREHIERGRDSGMQSFEQSILDLYKAGIVNEQVAVSESDNPANLRLVIKQHQMSKSIGSQVKEFHLEAHDKGSNKSQF